MIRFKRLLAPCALVAAACSGIGDDKALEVVREYDRALVEAYRAGDAKLVERWASAAEHKKIAGLIGVKLDLGITLDARLEELTPVSVTREGGDVVVTTEERWYYLDRRIGSGAQVGPDSHDHYTMRYRLERQGDRWVVGGVEFARAPEVGRPETFGADVKVMHGVDTLNPAQEKAAPPARPPGGGGQGR